MNTEKLLNALVEKMSKINKYKGAIQTNGTKLNFQIWKKNSAGDREKSARTCLMGRNVYQSDNVNPLHWEFYILIWLAAAANVFKCFI